MPTKNSPWKKWLKRLLALAILAGIAFALHHYGVFSPKPTVVHYETSPVSRGSIQAKVTATGTLSALVTVAVGSQVSGRILQILVDYNSIVKKGDVLARIDPLFFQAALEQSKANLLLSEANLEKTRIQLQDAERTFNRQKSLAEKNLTSASELDSARTSYDLAAVSVKSAEGSLAQARASLSQAEINLGYTTIYSPINGIVISRSIDVGQTVAASFQAPTLFTIAEDLKRMQVDTLVSEADIGKLQPGMAASFTVDAYPNEPFVGKVRQIRNAPQTTQNVVTYDAVIDVENPDLRLKPGMTASVSFIYAERKDVIKIPNAALRFRPSEKPDSKIPKGTDEPRENAAKPPASNPPSPSSSPGSDSNPSKPSVEPKENDRDPPGVIRKKVFLLQGAEAVEFTVRVGLTDGSCTEVVEGEVKEGDLAIVDESGSLSKSGAPSGGPRRLF